MSPLTQTSLAAVFCAGTLLASSLTSHSQDASQAIDLTAVFDSAVVAPESKVRQPEQVEAMLQELAGQLSKQLANPDFRGSVVSAFRTADRKNVIALSDLTNKSLAADACGCAKPGSKDVVMPVQEALALASVVQAGEEVLASAGLPYPRLELKVPVREHLEQLNASETIYVAAVPMTDEAETKAIMAYDNGSPVELSAETPPSVPTLVLQPAETESTDPVYPLTFSDNEGDEANPQRVVDDFVGIARIWIDDDHESWFSGDPEIYVRTLRFRFSDFRVINQRHNLPGVNGEQVWYNIGDPNGTYRFVSSSNYAPVVQFQIWESDSGAHGGDDHLGTVTVTWTNLPFGGYTTLINGDARIGVDRD